MDNKEELDFATKRDIINQTVDKNEETDFVNEQIVYMLHQLDKKRVEKNITYLTLATECGISVSYLYGLLHGHQKNLSLSKLLKICNAIGVEVAELLPEDAVKTKDITSGDLFEGITRDMSPKEKNALLEVVRNCKSIIKSAE